MIQNTLSFFLRLLLISAVLNCIGNALAEDKKSPYLYVLGVTQDAGYPQSACYEAHCMPGWKNEHLRRGAVSLGLVDTESKKKYMFEATPNFPEQLYRLDKKTDFSEYELDGIFLTHAHIGHYTGLMFLGHESMGTTNFPVYVMPKMEKFLRNNGPWSQLVDYKNIKLLPLSHQKPVDLKALNITPFLVPHRDEFSETVGYRIDGPNKSAIFIPDINKWTQWEQSIVELVASVDYALLDAAFYADGELPGRDMSKIPHPFATDTMKLFDQLPKSERNKIWFIHMNHTNPLLDSDSKESRYVRSLGYHIAEEGVTLGL